MTTVILQLICPDRAGLVSEISGWIASNHGNIRHADHHTDGEASVFLSRLEWDLEGFKLPRELIEQEVYKLANRLEGKAHLHFSDHFS